MALELRYKFSELTEVAMEFDETKVDDATLALMYLVTQTDNDISRAWKGFDWETLDRLHEAGYISNPATKARSIVMTKDGAKRSHMLFEQLFGSNSN